MPFVNIKIARGRTIAQKQELVEVLTREMVRVLEVKPEWVTIVIDEYSRENWASAGELHSLKFGSGYGSQGVVKE